MSNGRVWLRLTLAAFPPRRAEFKCQDAVGLCLRLGKGHAWRLRSLQAGLRLGFPRLGCRFVIRRRSR
jgi:hypothetical protein